MKLFNCTWLKKETKDSPIWTTAEGKAIPITEMTDAHLRNAIFYLNKRFGQLRSIQINESETQFQLIMHNTPADYWPIYDDMRKEANRRKLTWI